MCLYIMFIITNLKRDFMTNFNFINERIFDWSLKMLNDIVLFPLQLKHQRLENIRFCVCLGHQMHVHVFTFVHVETYCKISIQLFGHSFCN